MMITQPHIVRLRSLGLRLSDVTIAYTFLRLIFGINFFNHGFTRISDIGGFANSMADMFQKTAVPLDLVRWVGAIVPPVELVIGILLILGWATRPALVIGFILMMVLQGGVTILQQWDTAASQLIYCLIFFLLLAGAGFNAISLDAKLRRHSPLTEADVR